MDFDFSELEKINSETFKQVIQVVVDHYDAYVKDDYLKNKALTQIKKDTEKLTNIINKNNVDTI